MTILTQFSTGNEVSKTRMSWVRVPISTARMRMVAELRASTPRSTVRDRPCYHAICRLTVHGPRGGHSGADPLQAVQVGAENLGHHDASVRLLVLFSMHRDQGARHAEARNPFKRVQELRPGSGRAPKAQVCPAGLEVAHVRAGADLEPFGRSREPRPRCHRSSRTAKPRSAPHSSSTRYGRAEQAAGLLGVGQRAFSSAGTPRADQLVHLHLVELVPALDAPHVASGAHLFAPEARRVRDVA